MNIRRMDSEESRRFWEALELARAVVASWPTWLQRWSIGEQAEREELERRCRP